MPATLDQLHRVEQALSGDLSGVPEPVRAQVAEAVGDYTRRAAAAPRRMKEEQTDFLLTYGAGFWKIVARKKNRTDPVQQGRPPRPGFLSGLAPPCRAVQHLRPADPFLLSGSGALPRVTDLRTLPEHKSLPVHRAGLAQGLVNQNLERLTYPDGHFDIVITSDVMEHVRQDGKAHGEIARVLKPGGIYLFTVPHNWQWERNLIRVRVDDPDRPDSDVHVMEPEYHGDANGGGQGILAYRAYGRELAQQLAVAGLTLAYEKYDLPGLGIMNSELFYCKKSAPTPTARPKVFIHAGAPKTATTLIQVYLLNYFRHDDYFYLNPDLINDSGFLGLVHGEHERPIDFLELASGAGWKAGQSIVVSHEALLGYGKLRSIEHEHYFYGAYRNNAQRLKKLLADCDIEVVYYVRRQDEFIVSFYLEHLAYCHADMDLDFDEFIALQEPEKISWLNRLNELAEVFGEHSVRFGLFDEIKAGPASYVANFMHRIGVDIPAAEIPDLGQERPSLSAQAYQLAITARKLGLDAETQDALFEFLRSRLSNRTYQKAELLSAERRQWLMSSCEADNIAMFEKYFPDQPPRLWYQPSPKSSQVN